MRLFTFILLLLGSLPVSAQTLRGVITDNETGKPLYPVMVINLTKEVSVNTDQSGNYSIPAQNGDVLSFSFVGYHTLQKNLTAAPTTLNVAMDALSVQLKEYVLHPGYTPYQEDSARMAALYSEQLNTQPIKPTVSMNNNVAVNGLIGSTVQKMSKSYKKKKKFKENFEKDEQQKFIDTRYKPMLVTALTGFTGDTLAFFMNTYPMEYKFARAASDLELKMWIRDNYRDFMEKKSRK